MRYVNEASILHQAKLKGFYAEADQRRLAREVKGKRQGTTWQVIGAAARRAWQSVSQRGSNEGAKVLTNSKRLPTI